MSWQEQVVEHASALGRRVLQVAGGIGIEFADGCDVCWILPGEITSTLELSEPKQLMAEFTRIEAIRGRVLYVIRHHLARNKIRVDRRRSGNWPVESESGLSTTMGVGAIVTAGAVKGMDVHELVTACFTNTVICRKPIRAQVERYLAIQGPPAGEKTITEQPSAPAASDLRTVLAWMGLCRGLQSVTETQQPEQFARAASAKGRTGEALLRVAERLPGVEASCAVTDGSLHIEFADGEADYVVDVKSRELARKVRTLGPRAAGDEIADEYTRISAARNEVIQAITRAAAGRGWGRQRIGALALLGSAERSWYLGGTRREIQVSVGDTLTDLVRSDSPSEAIRQLLAANASFAGEAAAACGSEARVVLRDVELPPEVSTQVPKLAELDEAIIAGMDALADAVLQEYLKDYKTLWRYRDREVFDPRTDTWATMADWVRLAETRIGGEWPDPYAILVLLDAGDQRGVELAHQYVARASSDQDVSEAGVELVWRLRHELPEAARNWFAPQRYEAMPHAGRRAHLGDPVALRYLIADGYDAGDESTWSGDTSPAITGVPPAPEAVARIRERLLNWARSTWKWSPPQADELRKALWLGLPEVADALGENPFLLSGLLTGARRNEMMDEPGILMGAEFILVWSRLKPTRLMARLVGTLNEAGILAEAERMGRESVERGTATAGALNMSLSAYQKWAEELRVPRAIAWKRWRNARRGGQ